MRKLRPGGLLGLTAMGVAVALGVVGLGSAATGAWSPAPDMSIERSRHTATRLLDGRVLVVGTTRVGGGTTAEHYDPATGAWSPAGDLSEWRTNHVAVRLADGRVLVAGGDINVRAAELYDPATNSWSTTGSMNIGRREFAAALLQDGRVLVAGVSTSARRSRARSCTTLRRASGRRPAACGTRERATPQHSFRTGRCSSPAAATISARSAARSCSTRF